MKIAKDAPQLPSSPLAFVLHFLKLYKIPLMGMFILEFGQAACQIMIPKAIRSFIETAEKSNFALGDSFFDQFKDPILFFVYISVGILIFSRASGSILVMVGPSLRRKVRHQLYHYLQYHSQRYFTSHFSGSLANRISEVSMSVNHSLWTLMFDFWPTIVTFGFSFWLLMGVHAGLGYFLAGWILFYILVSYLLALRCKNYAKNFAEARSTVTGKIVDAVTNILNSKLFTQLSFERDHLKQYLDFEVDTARRTFWFMEKMRWFQFSSTLTLQIFVFVYALKLLFMKEISVGAFSMATSLSIFIISDARNLSRRFLEFFEYIGNISEGVQIIIKPHEILDIDQASNMNVQKGEITFKDVTFEYAEGKKVFENLSVTIRAGEKVGLVGFSGSGKSTFLNLIMRFFDVTTGDILIDGQSIKSVKQDSLRSYISMIPQEPLLFHRTLMENIRYGRPEASDAEVIQAAQMAFAHEFIEDKPEKYNSMVGERGIKLSGGQRQRIAIARAFLKNAPILLMDEATSSLDSMTEKKIQSSLKKLIENRTVIVIAHRLSTISHLDRILVFNEGKIVEDGSHESLLKSQGHYAKLWNMQAGGFLPESEETVH